MKHSKREFDRWSALFSGDWPHYGIEAGPVARRAVRYQRGSNEVRHASLQQLHALDAGCGEGQDLVYLAQSGYLCHGFDLTPAGTATAQRLLKRSGVQATTFVADLSTWNAERTYDLVLCVNALQFLGPQAPAALQRVAASVAPRGVLGLSLFARAEREADVRDGIYFGLLDEVVEQLNKPGDQASWQMLETANLWQWNERTNTAQPFITLIARRL
jgi:2-polyprenyl-3-methyl-5-hydroxy-6-metoxy-1,4-benzoquinol methylase